MNQTQDLPALEPDQTTVHQALAEASAAAQNKIASKVFSVRMPEDVKDTAQFICERHGTDLSTFLRLCAVGLVKDYGLDVEEPV